MTVATTPVNDLLRIVGRAAEITGSYGHTRVMPERIDAITRATLIVEQVHQELVDFVRFLYRRHPNGKLLHVLGDGQLARRVYTPWRGPSSLSRTQQDTLRRWLRAKATSRPRPPLTYGQDTRRWYLDLVRYPTVDDAISWLDRNKMTAGEWLNLV